MSKYLQEVREAEQSERVAKILTCKVKRRKEHEHCAMSFTISM